MINCLPYVWVAKTTLLKSLFILPSGVKVLRGIETDSKDNSDVTSTKRKKLGRRKGRGSFMTKVFERNYLETGPLGVECQTEGPHRLDVVPSSFRIDRLGCKMTNLYHKGPQPVRTSGRRTVTEFSMVSRVFVFTHGPINEIPGDSNPKGPRTKEVTPGNKGESQRLYERDVGICRTVR